MFGLKIWFNFHIWSLEIVIYPLSMWDIAFRICVICSLRLLVERGGGYIYVRLHVERGGGYMLD